MAAGTSHTAKPKAKLSRHLKQMKFMQRTQEKEEEDELERERLQRIDESHWALDLPELQVKESKYEVEPSLLTCEDLHTFGRMSYKGVNLTIEKIWKNIEAEKADKESDDREKKMAVTDEEMAARYGSLVGTIGKKFSKKRGHSGNTASPMEEENNDDYDTVPISKKHKKQFLKPSDDI